SKPTWQADWLAPGGHGLDDFQVDSKSDVATLAFLHLSEKAAASRFVVYRDIMQQDPPTRAVFEEILLDERFHMSYTQVQLVRVSSEHHRRDLWRARLSRLWKGYFRLATALAVAISVLILTFQFFMFLPYFEWFSKRDVGR